MDDREVLFISFTANDREIVTQLYNYFRARWPKIKIFYSEEISAGRDLLSDNYAQDCFTNCRLATLGIILLSEKSRNSSSVQQEIGCLIGCKIHRLYIPLDDSALTPGGLERVHQTPPFTLSEFEDPSIGFQKIADYIEQNIFLISSSKKTKDRLEFEQRFIPNRSHNNFPYRDQCALHQSIKCAEKKIRIMGENALQPIHGGFESLLKFLNEGGIVEVLIANYNSEAYNSREEIEGTKRSKRLRADWIATVSNLLQLNILKEQGTLHVKYSSEIQTSSLVIIDEWELQYNPYKMERVKDGNREIYSEVFLYLKGHEKFEYYTNLFSQRWNSTNKVHTLPLDEIDMQSIVPEKIPFLMD